MEEQLFVINYVQLYVDSAAYLSYCTMSSLYLISGLMYSGKRVREKIIVDIMYSCSIDMSKYTGLTSLINV